MSIVYRVGKNREAGAEIHVIDNRDESFELHGGDRDMFWITFCDTHSNYCTHRTRALAEEFAHHPASWCATCASEGEARDKQTQEQAPSTSKDKRREIDRRVYLAIFNEWAAYESDIQKEEGLNVKDIKNSLARLKRKGLVDSTHVNEDPKPMWQTMFDVENGDTEEEALASFDAAFGVIV